MTNNETRERVLAAEVDAWGIDREQPLTIRAVAKSWFRNGWDSALAVLPLPADTAALSARAQEALSYGLRDDRIDGYTLIADLRDALESSTREVERLRMALKEKERP